MESSAPVSRYVARNSKKRVFSSSSVYKGVEVLDLSSPPSSPANRASKPNFSEQKKVICHEIIDVDVEDHVDALRIDESGKGKKALSNSLVGFGNLEKDGSGSDIQKSKHLNVDDFNPTLFFGEDVCIDTFYDDTVYDYAIWGSQFDHMDIPPGVEAPFPWLSDSHQDYSKAGDLTTTSSSAICNQAGQNPKLKMSSTISTSSEAFFTAKNYNDSLHPGNVSSSRKRKKCHVKSSSNCYPSLGMSGVGTHMPIWSNSPLNMLEPPIGSSTTMNGSGLSPLVQDSSYIQSGVTSVSVDKRNVDDQLTLFKKFDTVEDFSDHHFAKQASSAKLGQKNWAKKIQEEWRILEKDLPDTIFVRVYESRMDLLRAVIVGAEGTPYHDGLFFFDAFFPSNYPSVPPKVHYHSGGLRINPNLYNCGKVCLSLLNTWTGHGQEKWVPGKSTMLQVLVSIQGLILNAKPYFNEPGYANTVGTKQGEEKSLDYNENTFMYSLQTMVYSMRRPPKYFEAYVAAHFCKVAREVLVSCKAYLDGAQVGCLVKGGVQDVDEGDKSCSKSFKTRLAGYMSILVNAFIKIGAKDCQEFLNLSEKSGTKRATGAAPTNLYI